LLRRRKTEADGRWEDIPALTRVRIFEGNHDFVGR